MKTAPEIRPRHGGFTLIEVLVATAIVAMLFTIVFGTFFYTINNAEAREEQAALYHRANFIVNNISQCVSCAHIPFGGDYSDEEEEKPLFFGSNTSLDDSEGISLSMFTSNPRFGGQRTGGGIAYVTYGVARAGDVDAAEWLRDENNPLILRCDVEPLLAGPAEEDEEQPQWELNIRSLNIEYFDEVDWLSEWSYEEQGALPDAVRIELELAGSNGDTYSFSSMVYVQVNTVLEKPPDITEDEEIEEDEEERGRRGRRKFRDPAE